MEKRQGRKIRKSTNLQPSFVEVIIMEESTENYQSEALDFEESTGGIEAVNKHNTERKSRKIIHHRRSRYTQVNPEEIDAWNIQISHDGSVPGENKPIQLIDNKIIVPQCRFCLRRVSFENLEIISNKHKAKAMTAFQMRIFPRDVYPYACTICLNLMDIFVDFKSSVTKAKSLLLTKRMHMESDGWDDANSIEAFKHCKAVVERHLVQVDTVYEECFNMNKEESVESTVENKMAPILESTLTVELDNSYNRQLEEQYNPKIQKSQEKMDDIDVMPAVEWDLGQDFGLNHNQFEQLPDCPSPNERIKNHKKGRNPSNAEEVVEEYLKDGGYNPSTLNSSKVNPDDNLPASPKKRPKRIRKAKPSTAFNSNQSQEQQKPLGLRVLCDLCGESMWPESLESHKNRHLGIKPYTCPANGCNFTFYSRANMATHMRRMHDEMGIQSHKCDICGKFVRGRLGCLNAHKKRHTNEKKYVCELCDKAFTMPAYLKQHSITHSGELPHQCGYCGKKFNNKWSMKTHEKNIHKKNNHVPMSNDELMKVTIDSECT